MSTAPSKDERARAADRIGMDYPVPILSLPTSNAKVKGKSAPPESDKGQR